MHIKSLEVEDMNKTVNEEAKVRFERAKTEWNIEEGYNILIEKLKNYKASNLKIEEFIKLTCIEVYRIYSYYLDLIHWDSKVHRFPILVSTEVETHETFIFLEHTILVNSLQNEDGRVDVFVSLSSRETETEQNKIVLKQMCFMYYKQGI
ncbi:MAG: hypothetical protein WKF59_20440 [Chitinophagaceae bacterium]